MIVCHPSVYEEIRKHFEEAHNTFCTVPAVALEIIVDGNVPATAETGEYVFPKWGKFVTWEKEDEDKNWVNAAGGRHKEEAVYWKVDYERSLFKYHGNTTVRSPK